MDKIKNRPTIAVTRFAARVNDGMPYKGGLGDPEMVDSGKGRHNSWLIHVLCMHEVILHGQYVKHKVFMHCMHASIASIHHLVLLLYPH